MPPVTTNPVAQAVAGKVENHTDPALGAVVLRGFLRDTNPKDTADETTPVRIYMDETFLIYYEFPRSAVLYTVSGSGNHLFYAKDIVWVRRDAPVTKCRRAHAWLFAENDEVEMADDPAAGPRKPSYP